MDVSILRSWFRQLVAAKILRRVDMIVSIAIPESADDAHWLCQNRPNFQIPDTLIRRLEQSRDAQQEGVAIAAELLADVADIPGVSGVHLMATRNLTAIPAVLAEAGMTRQTA
jgi:methylenetetrahydrofolate reductase (NADPH)